MNAKALLGFAISLSLLGGQVAQAQTAVVTPQVQEVDEFGDVVTGKTILDYDKYQVVNVGDWRAPKASINWSQPVIVRDDFDGDYLAVFDRNYQHDFWNGAETGVRSNWSENTLRIYAYEEIPCRGWFCSNTIAVRETATVAVKVGDQVFRMEGVQGNYSISPEMAYALKTAPAGNTRIKITLEGSGTEIVNDIGAGTVQAWQTVYQAATPTN